MYHRLALLLGDINLLLTWNGLISYLENPHLVIAKNFRILYYTAEYKPRFRLAVCFVECTFPVPRFPQFVLYSTTKTVMIR